MGSSAVLAHESDRMRIIHHHHGAIFFSEVADLGQFRDVAVHRENAVGRDHLETRIRGLFEFLLKVAHVTVLVTKPLAFAETDAVDHARVIQFVGDDRVLFSEERLEESTVRIEARCVENRVLGSQEFTELLFKFLMDALRSADESHRRQTESPFLESLVSGFDDFRVIRQPEIVVRAHVEHVARRDIDVSILRALDDAFVFIKTRIGDLSENSRVMFLRFSVHI